MAEVVDEARIIAWLDGELDPADAVVVERAVASDAELAALAARHQRMKARFTAAFAPLAAEPAAGTSGTTVISLAAVRAEREDRRVSRPWMVPGAIAASLVLGVMFGRALPYSQPIGDRADALALSAPISASLDRQLSGDAGAVRVALSFRDRDGHYCRSFAAKRLSGIACREDDRWRLRYGSHASGDAGDYRMAAGDRDRMSAVEAMIAGDPLDRQGEERARDSGWE